MKVILPLIPDPADVVIAGMCIGDTTIEKPYEPIASLLNPVLQGEIATSRMSGFPVPRAMIGQSDWNGILPRQIGPMRMAGGIIEMLNIGASPVNVFVDPTQRFLASAYKVDNAGIMISMDADVIGAPEVIAQYIIPGSDPIGNPTVTIPRGAIFRSGLAKRVTSPNLPDSFGRHTVVDSFIEATTGWDVTVTVRDELGAVVSGATVYLMDPTKYISGQTPTNQQGLTDVNGQCVFRVSYFLIRQMLAWKDGVPAKGGISVITTNGNFTTTLYIKDPTTLGAGISIPVVGNTGLVRAA